MAASIPGPRLRARLAQVEAVLFDLDGVLTPTAELHEAAWRETFDEFLRAHAQGAAARGFSHDDYLLYVDGRPRLDGVRGFLASRGLALPEGHLNDSTDAPTVLALAERKNQRFQAALDAGALQPFPGVVELLDLLPTKGVRRAVVSASHNCTAVLASAGLGDRFEMQVDGDVADREGLRGKPAPDTFLAAARSLGVPREHCAVVEDALAGVEAARAGGFGVVVGVDRTGAGALLRTHGADLVVRDMRELVTCFVAREEA